jgi:hypothetical protein
VVGTPRRLTSLCCICFCWKLLYIISPVFSEMTLVRPSICIIWRTAWNWIDFRFPSNSSK